MTPIGFNPNAMPNTTNFRFFLLASSVLFVTLWIAHETLTSLRFINGFVSGISASILLWMIALLFALALVVYFLHPIYCSRSFAGSLTPAPDDVTAFVEKIASRVGIRNLRILMDRDITNFDACAFGYPRRRRIALGRGNILLMRKRPDIFRAKMHHELAHLSSQDVEIAYLAVGLLFAGGAILTASLVYWLGCFAKLLWLWQRAGVLDQAPFHESMRLVPLILLSAVGIAALWLQHRALIRDREIMADAEASYWCQDDSIELALGSTTPAPRRFFHWVRQIGRLHPSVETRKRALDVAHSAGNPTPLLMMGTGFLFLANINIFNVISGRYYSDDVLDAVSCEKIQCIQDISDVISENFSYTVLMSIGYLSSILIFAFLGSVILRFVLQVILNGALVRKISYGILVLSMAFSFGCYLSYAFDVFYFFSAGVIILRNLISLDDVLRFFVVWVFVFIVGLALMVFGLWLARGGKVFFRSQLAWFAISLFIVLFVGQVIFVPLSIVWFGEEILAGGEFVMALFSGVALWGCLSLVLGIVIRKKLRRLAATAA